MPTYSKETALYDTGAIANGINEAGLTAETYITDVTSGGVFVHTTDSVAPRVPQTAGNYGVHIDGDSVDIINDGEVVASYGENATVGKSDGAHVELDEDSLVLKNADQVAMYAVESSDVISEIKVTESLNLEIPGGEEATHTFNETPDTGTDVQVVCRGRQGMVYIHFTAGTPGSEHHANTGVTATYDGNKTVTVSMSSYSIEWYGRFCGVYYYVESHEPAMVFGTNRSDPHGFSASFGEELSTGSRHQLVIGHHNSQSDGALIIGKGTAPTPRNIFKVDWSGNVTAFGTINAAVGYTVGTYPLIQSGQTDTISATANSYVDVTVTFPSAFEQEPNVVVGFMSTSTAAKFGLLTCAAHSITTTGFKVRVFNADTGNRTPRVFWIATTQ